MLKFPRILYFITEPVPTAEEIIDSRRFGFNVAFRNAQLAAEGCPEDCAGVAGAVPESYKKFPEAENVIREFMAQQSTSIPSAKAVRTKSKKEEEVNALPGMAPSSDPTASWGTPPVVNS
jgi:hypothetical protein